MAKEDIINMEGRVEEVLPAAMFRIKLDNLPNLIVAVHGSIFPEAHISSYDRSDCSCSYLN